MSFFAIVLEEIVQLSEELYAQSVRRLSGWCSVCTSPLVRCSLPMVR